MSGIAALLFTDARGADGEAVIGMLAALRHRFTEGVLLGCDGPVAIGGERERDDRGAAPRHRLLALDGRIDNAPQLADELQLPRSASAARLIESAYDRWEHSTPARLTGDFAFVLWDARRRQLVAARDQLGIKPLYYATGRGFIALASEMKALLTLPDVSRALDETRVVDFLEGVLDDMSTTFYAAIRRLPPAHVLVADGDGLRISRYWELAPADSDGCRTEDDWVQRVRKTFVESVRCRIPGEGDVGSMLSGGLDSSSITCVARDLLRADGRAPLHTFTALFPGIPRSDEGEFVDAVVATGGIRSHRFDATELAPLDHLELHFAQQDEPRLAANLYLTMALLERVRATGISVVLDGIDGDTVVSHGIRRLTELAHARRWRDFVTESEGVARLRRRDPLLNARHYALPSITSRARNGEWGTAASDVFQLARFSRLSAWTLFNDALLRPLLTDPLRRRLGRSNDRSKVPDPRRLTNAELYRRTGAAERHAMARQPVMITEREDHRWRLTRGIFAYGFEIVDHAAAAQGLEVRFPFFDRRFVELSLAVPSEYKLRAGWSRYVLRRALEGVLPPDVQWRTGKADIGVYLREAMLVRHRTRLEALVRDGDEQLDAFVDRDRLRARYDDYVRSRAERPTVDLWKTAVLAQWLRGERGKSSGMKYAKHGLRTPRADRSGVG
jgi:asparagine synthase (glutamine-hydrolysing)